MRAEPSPLTAELFAAGASANVAVERIPLAEGAFLLRRAALAFGGLAERLNTALRSGRV